LYRNCHAQPRKAQNSALIPNCLMIGHHFSAPAFTQVRRVPPVFAAPAEKTRGAEVLHQARRILSINDQIVSGVGLGPDAETVRIGIATLYTGNLAGILRECGRAAHPARVQVRCDHSSGLLCGIRAGLLDLVLARGNEEELKGRFTQLAQCGLAGYGIRRIDEDTNANGLGHQLMQEREPLGLRLVGEKIEAGRVAVRPGEACHKAELDRVSTNAEDNRDRCCCRSCRDRERIANWEITATRQRTRSAITAGRRSKLPSRI
jgi:hypothetical protein